MKLNKLIALGIVAVTLASPMSALATTTNSTNIKESVTQSQEEMDKLSTYGVFNTTTKQFQLSPTAQTDLSKSELVYLQKAMAETNKKVKDIYKDKSVNVTVKDNTLKVTPKVSRSIDYNSYWDYEIKIIGVARIFMSRSFVNDMTSKVGNTTVFFAGGGTALAMEQLLVRVGMASGPAGWIALACGGSAVYLYDQIVSNCNDTGVFVQYTFVTKSGSVYGA